MTENAKPRTPLIDRRKMLVGLGLLGAASIAQARLPEPNRPKIPTDKLEDMIPDVVGQWRYETASGLVLPPPDALSERTYDSVVTRIYTNPTGQVLMMLAAYNNRQDGVLQIHRPEVCYPASGFALSPTNAVDVPLQGGGQVPSQAFEARGPQRDEVVLYWTRVGSDFPRRWAEQRLAVAKANLAGIIPDGLLVRVSTLGADMATELPILTQFIGEFSRVAPPRLSQLFFDRLPAAPAA